MPGRTRGPELNGFLVLHKHYGLGKILEFDGRIATVLFVDTGKKQQLVAAPGVLEHALLTPGRNVATTRKLQGEVVRVRPANDGPHEYEIALAPSGSLDWFQETDLLPLPDTRPPTPLSLLRNRTADSYGAFQSRAGLLEAVARTRHDAAGVQALLSSRIDLRAHQAFVAGTVLLDDRRRYILADEVGLGKTIEAGIVIHDLLHHRPNARVLILCPSALTRQWLCEMYAKFTGQIFSILALNERAGSFQWATHPRLIASTMDALRLSSGLLAQSWDLVVVDEAHHLLTTAALYDLVENLSTKSPSVLLLSALPAQRREDEYRRLLHLLEPALDERSPLRNAKNFQELFDAQEAIGRRLRRLAARLDAFEAGELALDEVNAGAKQLGESIPGFLAPTIIQPPPLSEDRAEVGTAVRAYLQQVADSCRLNRRILRNRRERLIDEDAIAQIERTIEMRPYRLSAFEGEAWRAAQSICAAVTSSTENKRLSRAFARVVLHSLCAPTAFAGILSILSSVKPQRLTAHGVEFVGHGGLVGAQDWDDFVSLLMAAVRSSVPTETLIEAMTVARAWSQESERSPRCDALFDALAPHKAKKQKVIVFAGFPGVAARLADEVRSKFGKESTTEFLEDAPDDEKERNVERFRSNTSTWVLVSDESGGEGRNFQFAHTVVHFDTPWFPSRVEQRIGRIDRLGREAFASTAPSIVLVGDGSAEHAMVECLNEGLGIYRKSISGLEFALREVEDRLIDCAQREDAIQRLQAEQGPLRDLAANERARADSDSLLDTASFQKATAQRYLRVSSTAETAAALEAAFAGHFKFIGKGRAVSSLTSDLAPNGILRFFPDQIPGLELPNGQMTAQSGIDGTFRRDIAQRVPRLNFLSPGNAFFDAFVRFVHEGTAGSVYAVHLNSPAEASWAGFEFIFRAQPTLPPGATTRPGVLSRIDEVFTSKPVHVFVDANGKVELRPDKLLRLRREQLKPDLKNKTWFNLKDEKATALERAFAPRSWAEVFDTASEVARNRATAVFEEQLSGRIDAERERAGKAFTAGFVDQDEFQLLRDALARWSVEIDGVGFLGINQGLTLQTMGR